MLDRQALVDTNVLIYAFTKDSEYYKSSRELLNKAQEGELSLCITPQVLAEFYAIATDPRRTSVPQEPHETANVIDQLLAMPGMVLLSLPVDVVNRWTTLIRQHPVRGSDIFDVQLVATMLGNGVNQIYTYNRLDFEKFSEIEVLTPS